MAGGKEREGGRGEERERGKLILMAGLPKRSTQTDKIAH